MGMQIHSQIGGRMQQGTRRRRRSSTLMSEINVTPFVDVMLVLLIIFMVAAPLMVTGVTVDLPDAETAAIQDIEEPLTVSVDPKGDIYLQDQKVTMDELIPKLEALLGQKKEPRIFLRGDDAIAYGKVMEVMAVLSSAGYTKLALLTDQPSAKR